MYRIYSVLILAICVSLISCNKDDDPIPDNSGNSNNGNNSNNNYSPPVAVNDSLSLIENTNASVNVLANDTGTNTTVSSTTSPSNGTIVESNGTITYTPNTNYIGSDQFTYTIIDDSSNTSVGTVNVTVTDDASNNNTNTAPVANNDSETTNMNSATTINVTSNDTDADSDALTVTNVTSASNGTVVNNNDGTITYTPDATFIGTETLTYTISDGTETATATVTITVGNAAQTATYNLLSPYFAIEMTLWDGLFTNKFTVNADGTFSQIGTGPLGLSNYNGSYTINTSGDIVFESSLTKTVTTYSNIGYDGYSFDSLFNYVVL